MDLFDPRTEPEFARAPAIQSGASLTAARPACELAQPGSVVLRYKSMGTRRMVFVLGALFPFWGLWVPYALFCLIASLPAANPETMGMLAGCLCVLAVAALAVWASFDHKVILDAQGITLPVGFLLKPASVGQRRLKWADLQSLKHRAAADEQDGQVILQFKNATVKLQIGGLTKQDLKKLVLTAQAHCPQGGDAASSAPSLTEIWEREMTSRFSCTVFVPLAPATKLQNGRVEIIGQSSSGGLSAIYMARLADGRKVIVKEAVLPSTVEDSIREKAIEMFQREASLLQSLNHARISHVLDHFSEDGRHYLVMEHIPGVDLRRFIRDNGKQHEEIALRWALEVSDVLSYLHSRVAPVIHRDLTPDNLLFTTDGGIAVIDFGAANAFVAEATGTLVGKQNYISPEQFRGRATPQSDLYSLGCTLYFLLTGCDPEPLCESHPRAANPDVSEMTDALVARCTALDLDKRVDSAESLHGQLRATIQQMRRRASTAGI